MTSETEVGVPSVSEGPLYAGRTERSVLGAETPVTEAEGQAGSSSKWRVLVAALLVLGACAEQSTEPAGEIPGEVLKAPIPSYTTPTLPDFSRPCIAPGGAERFADDSPGFQSEQCVQRFTSWLAARPAARSAETAAASAVPTRACPVTSHDVVVSTIADLRAAVAGTTTGARVIGIDGLLDINSDGGGDVVVANDSITLTCASDGAGLVGEPTGGVGVLDVLAHQVRVEWLDVIALPETGSGDRSRGVVIRGDGGVVSQNRVDCERTCIYFLDVSGGMAEDNDISAGFKFFGIVAQGGRDVAVADNMLGVCVRCVQFVEHASGIIENNQVNLTDIGIALFASDSVSVVGNTVEECFVACVGAFAIGPDRSTNPTVDHNRLSECGGLFSDGCVWLDALDGGLVQENEIHGVPDAAAVRITPFDGPANDVIVHDNLAEGSLWAFQSSQIAFTENTVSNCAGYCALLYLVPEAEVHGNHLTGADNDVFGISVTESPGLSVVRNTLRGSFNAGGIDIDNGNVVSDYRISSNDIAIEAGDFGTGIRLQLVENSQVDRNMIDLGDGGPSSTGIVLNGAAGFFKEVVNGEIIFEFSLFFPATDNVLAANQISGARVGLFVNGACTNTFVGNNLGRNGTGALFVLQSREIFTDPSDPTRQFIFENDGTGANTLAGDHTAVVEDTYFGGPVADSGYLDCDMDGTRDPNIYSGTGTVQRGGLGTVIGNVMSQLHRPTQEELTGS